MSLLALSAFVSGAAALAAQVVWLRRLGELFGAGALAAAAVLALFFLGMGLGGRLLGALADRRGGAIGLVVAIELLAAGAALCFWPAASALERVHAELVPLEASLSLRWAAQLAAAGVLVLPAALAMGGQLPALVRHAVQRAPELAPRVAGLYGWNTLGAACGVAAAGFLLLPRAGLPVTLACAAGGHLLAAVLAWLGRMREPSRAAGDEERAGRARGASAARTASAGRADALAATPAPEEVADRTRRLLRTTAFLSGAVAIGLELVWTRALAARFSGTVYAYAAVLVAYLAALGAGGLVAGALARRGALDGERRVLVVLARAWLGLALGILLSGALLSRLPGFRVETGLSLAAQAARELGLSLLVLAPALACAGLVFPLLVAALARDPSRLGRGFGTVGWINALGSALGPALLGFGLLPLLGLRTSLLALAGLALASAFALARAAAGGTPRLAWAALLAALVLASGVRDLRRWPSERGERLVAYREGFAASMAVVEEPGGNRALALGSDYRLGDLATRFAQARQGALPLMLHAAPRRALHVGLGTGASAGALLELASARGEPLALDVVEIVPDLARFALGAFAPTNGGLESRIARGEARLLGVDARAFARRARERYDLVVADLFVPWRAGEGAMYTREQFDAYREALREDGLCVQWLPLYQLDREGLRTIAATFLDAFPGAGALWLYYNAEQPVLGLVGGRGAVAAPGLDAREESEGARAFLVALGLEDPLERAGAWIAQGEELARWCADAPRETRARPRVEFRAPAYRLEDEGARTADVLADVLALAERGTARDESAARAARRAAVTAALRSLAASGRGRGAEACEHALAALRSDPAWRFAALQLEACALERLRAGEREPARAALEALRAASARPGSAAIVEAALAWVEGDAERARTALRRGLALEPHDPHARALARELGLAAP